MLAASRLNCDMRLFQATHRVIHLPMQNNAPQDKEAASLLAADVAAHAPFFTPADASRTMYALAKLGVSQPSVYQAVAAQLAAAPSDLSQMSCKELALLAWAYAKAGVLHAPLMEAIAQVCPALDSFLAATVRCSYLIPHMLPCLIGHCPGRGPLACWLLTCVQCHIIVCPLVSFGAGS